MPDIPSIDKRYLWHPFTQMKEWENDDDLIAIESAEGVILRDTRGREFIDGVSSLWCNVHGHQRGEINDAIRAQLDKVAHSTLLGLTTPPAALLAEKLISLAPEGLTKVFYSDSGATAVEIALKMAFQYWQQCAPPRPEKTKFICLPNAYHGDTIGAVSVGGMELFHQIFHPMLFETLTVESPYARPPDGTSPAEHLQHCLDSLESLLFQRADEVAALILEPLVQGAAGMLLCPPGYLKGVRRLCSQYRVLLIADEVAVGFGRTGRMFACEHEQVTPDLMALGKGLTGGYLPVAATLTTQGIYEAFLGDFCESRTFFHGHTFTGNALGCAAALASLELFQKDRVIENLQPKIQHLEQRIEADFRPLPHVGEIRHMGFMVGMDLVKESGEPYPPETQMGSKVCREARNHGVLIRPLGNTLVIMPPLCITVENLDRLLDGIPAAISSALGSF